MPNHPVLVWFRRDLRLSDHTALALALQSGAPVACAFIFDTDILDPLRLESPQPDRRVEFIHLSVTELDAELRRLGSALIVRHGRAEELIVVLARELGAATVFANHDYEPQAQARDERVRNALQKEHRNWISSKDQVIFERDEIMTAQGRFFSVFTPYKRAWLKRLGPNDVSERACGALGRSLVPLSEALDRPVPSLEDMGFGSTNLSALGILAGSSGAAQTFANFLKRIDSYHERRDFPAVKGPSYLSIHLRFGTISIRALVRAVLARLREGANPGADTWLSELIWRDFYAQILYHRPDAVEQAFKPEYNAIRWETGRQADALYEAWCMGKTGYPLVDAAMNQINQTGYMHNRLRMVAASFLIKDLGIDWRRGEQYFALQLNDFDLASNNGGWQWAASSGCDAQPYFRIFNPTTQSEKFDPEAQFIRRYLPVLARVPGAAIHTPWIMDAATQRECGCVIGKDYPAPLVDHALARARTLERYQIVKRDAAGPSSSPT